MIFYYHDSFLWNYLWITNYLYAKELYLCSFLNTSYRNLLWKPVVDFSPQQQKKSEDMTTELIHISSNEKWFIGEWQRAFNMRIRVQFFIHLKVERGLQYFSIFSKILMKYFSPLSESGFFYNGSNQYYLIVNCMCDKCLFRCLTFLSFSPVTNPSQFIASYDFKNIVKCDVNVS